MLHFEEKEETCLHSLSLSHLKLQPSIPAHPLPNENTNVDFQYSQSQIRSLPSPLLFYSHMYTLSYDKLMYISFYLPSITWGFIYYLLVLAIEFSFQFHQLQCLPQFCQIFFQHIKMYYLYAHNFLSAYNISKFSSAFHFPALNIY